MDVSRIQTLTTDHIRFNPQPVRVVVLCSLALAVVSLIGLLTQLRGVLVPLVFAVFLAFLMEPILSAIVLAPQSVARTWHRLRRQQAVCLADPAAAAARPAAAAQAPQGASCSEEGPRSAATGTLELEPASADEPRGFPRPLLVFLQRLWDVLSILLCVAVLSGFLAGVVLAAYGAVQSFDWDAYMASSRLKDLEDAMQHAGISLSNLTASEIFSDYKGEVVSTALLVFSILKSVLLTVLLFIFCMVAILPGIHQRVRRSRVKRLMQRYLVCKTIASLVVAFAVVPALWMMRVPLVAVFGLLTFVLNFIPNIGSFFAILAPLPLVLLDPARSIWDAILVVLVPFGIHNSLGCIVESSVMAEGLDMHPLTVVVALTFWGSVWGAAGAVLAVPVSCCLKLWLEEVNHPYARTIHDMFNSPFGRSKSAKELEEARSTRVTDFCSHAHSGLPSLPLMSKSSASSASSPAAEV